MEVNYFRRPGSLMQVIDILRDDGDIEIFFQFSKPIMRCIGFCICYILTPHIIEVKYKLGVSSPCTGCSYFGYVIAFPETITIAKSFQAALRTDACTG